MMKKILTWAALLLALAACGEKEKIDEPVSTQIDVTGYWELTSVATKASVGSVNVSVFLEFASNGNFTLYQKIGEGRYTRFTGSYTLSSDNQLSGSYAGGSAWGPYNAALSGGSLVLTSPGGKEVDSYKKVSAIPETVTGNLY